MGYWKDGVYIDEEEPQVPIPEAPTHPSDDGRVLEGFDGWQRVAHFDYLENVHIYERKYPPIEEQLDMLYWDKVNGTENWKAAIDKVKADTPKAE
jgi:hypothetical protein|tara:strand:+ start:319 stop:603 length:285 start_codon:yes stop_codon:yes gene_type:complete